MNAFKNICAELKKEIPSPNPWRWDEEFSVARIVFRRSDADRILSLLERVFSDRYDFSTIGKSAGSVDAFIGDLFGIIPGQLVFTISDPQGAMLFAAWWPWGNEAYISLRIGLRDSDESPLNKEDIEKNLSEWFSIE